MTVHVRPASIDDDASLLAVDRATWTPRTSPTPPPDWSRPRRFFRDDRGPEGFLVAELDREVIGFVALHQTLDVPAHAHVLTVDGLGVLPGRQGLGVGTALVRAALDRARELGARRVTLRVLGGNTAARAVYERCGFVVEGVLREEFVLDGEPVDDVLMARSV